MNSRGWFLGLALSLAAAGVQADKLVMKNGSVLIGTLVSADESKVVFNTPFAGDITVEQFNIKNIVTEGEVDLLLKDGSLYRGKQIVTEDDRLFVLQGEDKAVEFVVPDIDMVNPEPWRIGDGYNWFGQFNFSMESERGNSDTDELDTDLESIWRSMLDRYTVRGNWEVDEANNERNKYSWMLHGKYDRFSGDDPDNYWGAQIRFDHDEFQDLDLRTSFGPYVGREFIDRPRLRIHAEIGFAYVDEQFDVAEDNDYWGATWEARMLSEPFWGLEFYINQDGVVDVTDASQLIVNTTVGVHLPTVLGITTSAEAVYEYDGGAVEGVDDTDETYRFKVGYHW
ncbi:MAG: hypothetical protein Hals2KO_31110 [Halioglobus sp.]